MTPLPHAQACAEIQQLRDVKPVAWRYRWKLHNEWTSWRVADHSQEADALFSLEQHPLYDAAALAALTERNAELEAALEPILSMPVNDAELLRIRNGAEMTEGDVRIWNKMLLTLVDAIRDSRRAATVHSKL